MFFTHNNDKKQPSSVEKEVENNWKIEREHFYLKTVFIFLGVCSTKEIGYDEQMIDFYPFHFMFPAGQLVNQFNLINQSIWKYITFIDSLSNPIVYFNNIKNKCFATFLAP